MNIAFVPHSHRFSLILRFKQKHWLHRPQGQTWSIHLSVRLHVPSRNQFHNPQLNLILVYLYCVQELLHSTKPLYAGRHIRKLQNSSFLVITELLATNLRCDKNRIRKIGASKKFQSWTREKLTWHKQALGWFMVNWCGEYPCKRTPLFCLTVYSASGLCRWCYYTGRKHTYAKGKCRNFSSCY